MAKRPRSPKQLASDERLRRNRKVITEPTPVVEQEEIEEEDFVPTEVEQHHAIEAQQQAGIPVSDFKAPTILENEETQEVVEEALVSPQMPITPEVDVNLVATIIAAITAIQQAAPQIAQASPDEKADEAARMLGVGSGQNKAVLSNSGIQGITYRYEIEKSHYPDPTARLLQEPKLVRFALSENYRFRWNVDGEQFEKHGMTFAEPRFTLELFRLLFDDEGKETGRMALVARAIQHEDDFIVRMAASNLGLLNKYEDSEEGFRLLRDEIRYYRLQQWLFSIFTPPKITSYKRAPRQEVIAGKVVEVYDTQELIDHDSGLAKASSVKSETGIGGVATPEK